jgi:hypothetical protein
MAVPMAMFVRVVMPVTMRMMMAMPELVSRFVHSQVFYRGSIIFSPDSHPLPVVNGPAVNAETRHSPLPLDG